MNLLKGKPVADAIKADITERIDELFENGVAPTLAILRVGENPDDIAYENGASKVAASLGIAIEKFTCMQDIKEEDLIDVIKAINENEGIHGLLMFSPLPKHINEEKVREAVNPGLDVDGMTVFSQSGIYAGRKDIFPPCTAEAVMSILKFYGINPEGKNVTVIGRSLVIGKPVAMMLMAENATVTVCHSRTPREEVVRHCLESDIIVSAAGRIGAVTAEMIRDGQVLVDVGINFDDEGKMTGDIMLTEEEKEKFDISLTPVPGGVGSVTTSLLMYHVLESAFRRFDYERVHGKC